MSTLNRVSAESIERNKQVKRLRELGWSMVELAKFFDVTRQRIQQILKDFEREEAMKVTVTSNA